MVSARHGHYSRMEPGAAVRCPRVCLLLPPFPAFPSIPFSRAYARDFLCRHFACCMGDTLASELGILSSTPPILLTTLRTVPPGTNGALSLLGTAASIGGGMAMGWTMWAALSVENAACRDQTGDLFLLLLGWGAVAGGMGSLVRIRFSMIVGLRVTPALMFFFGW
jgi:hypothetical protein